MRQLDAYKRIAFMCEQAGFDPKDVYALSKILFTLYQDSKIAAVPRKSSISKEEETLQKQKLRREFLAIMRLPVSESFERQKAFVWDALSVEWIDDKISMVIDKISNFPPDGAVYKKILELSYLQNHYMNDLELFEACNLRKSAFYKKREAALTLFGITLWNYAEAREQEDKALGII